MVYHSGINVFKCYCATMWSRDEQCVWSMNSVYGPLEAS